jgi:formylmethanofuran dehydrogenase subunit E
VLRGGALPPDPVHIALFAKLRAGSATPEEKERFHQFHREKNRKILEMKKEDLFQASPVKFDFPEKARIMASKECARCGEPTMVTRLEESPAGWVCRACQP